MIAELKELFRILTAPKPQPIRYEKELPPTLGSDIRGGKK